MAKFKPIPSGFQLVNPETAIEEAIGAVDQILDDCDTLSAGLLQSLEAQIHAILTQSDLTLQEQIERICKWIDNALSQAAEISDECRRRMTSRIDGELEEITIRLGMLGLSVPQVSVPCSPGGALPSPPGFEPPGFPPPSGEPTIPPQGVFPPQEPKPPEPQPPGQLPIYLPPGTTILFPTLPPAIVPQPGIVLPPGTPVPPDLVIVPPSGSPPILPPVGPPGTPVPPQLQPPGQLPGQPPGQPPPFQPPSFPPTGQPPGQPRPPAFPPIGRPPFPQPPVPPFGPQPPVTPPQFPPVQPPGFPQPPPGFPQPPGTEPPPGLPVEPEPPGQPPEDEPDGSEEDEGDEKDETCPPGQCGGPVPLGQGCEPISLFEHPEFWPYAKDQAWFQSMVQWSGGLLNPVLEAGTIQEAVARWKETAVLPTRELG